MTMEFALSFHPPAAGVITEQFLKEQGTLLRGLAHPVIFAQTFGSGGSSEGGEEGSSAAGSASASGADDGQQSRNGLPAWDPNRMFNSALQGGHPNPLVCRASVLVGKPCVRLFSEAWCCIRWKHASDTCCPPVCRE